MCYFYYHPCFKLLSNLSWQGSARNILFLFGMSFNYGNEVFSDSHLLKCFREVHSNFYIILNNHSGDLLLSRITGGSDQVQNFR